MQKMVLTFLLPTMAILVTACGNQPKHQHTFSSDWKFNETNHWHEATCGHDVIDAKGNHIDSDGDEKCDVCQYAMPKPTPLNEELEKFNELVAAIKKNHNYTLTVHSLVEGLEDQELNCHRYNLNNKAWFHDNSSAYDAEGIIYQKDQGFVTFAQSGNRIIPMSLSDQFNYETDPKIFVSTNQSLNISDLVEVIGENLFIGDYVQDSTNKAKFTTTNIDNRTVAVYLTQYFDYIQSGQLQISDSMSATVDVINSSITLELNYSLWYYDETEINAPGTISIKLENVDSTSNEVIQNYIENPTYTFERVTSWPSEMSEVFAKRNNSVAPTLPTGLSYAAVCEDILYEGFYYAGIQDMNSGDISESYGQTLISEGYNKVSSGTYTKVDIDGFNSVTYKVIMKYYKPSETFPKGEMKILFRADKTSSVFSSISVFNSYLNKNKYDELIPALPNEETCENITNVKDTTDNEEYCLKFNSVDTFKVNIPSFDKAQSFVNAYADLLIEKGYSDKSSFFSTTNYGLSWSTSGSYVAIDFPTTATSYKGYVGIRYIVTKADEQSLRPAQKYTVSMSSSVLNGSIDFGGVTEYSAGSIVNFTILPNPGYEFESASIVGTDIPVSINGNKGSFTMPNANAVVLVTFKELPPEPTHAINLTCSHFTLDHFEDEGGNVITKYIYKEDAFGIFAYGHFEEGFEFDSVTLAGDSDALSAAWFDDECNFDVIQIYPTKELDEYNIEVITKGVTYTIGKESITGATIKVAGMIKEANMFAYAVELGERGTIEIPYTYDDFNFTSFSLSYNNEPIASGSTVEVELTTTSVNFALDSRTPTSASPDFDKFSFSIVDKDTGAAVNGYAAYTSYNNSFMLPAEIGKTYTATITTTSGASFTFSYKGKAPAPASIDLMFCTIGPAGNVQTGNFESKVYIGKPVFITASVNPMTADRAYTLTCKNAAGETVALEKLTGADWSGKPVDYYKFDMQTAGTYTITATSNAKDTVTATKTIEVCEAPSLDQIFTGKYYYLNMRGSGEVELKCEFTPNTETEAIDGTLTLTSNPGKANEKVATYSYVANAAGDGVDCTKVSGESNYYSVRFETDNNYAVNMCFTRSEGEAEETMGLKDESQIPENLR